MTALALTTQSAANPPSPGSSQETSKAGTADFAGAGNAERVNGGSPLVADIVTRAFDGIGERQFLDRPRLKTRGRRAIPGASEVLWPRWYSGSRFPGCRRR